MQALLGRLDFWLIIVGGLAMFGQMLHIIVAERGRKRDLVRAKFANRQDFQLAVLIPYLNSSELPQVQRLLRALKEQQYPVGRLAIHLVTSQDTQSDFQFGLMGQNVHHWVYPDAILPSESGKATQWLIDRCLASGQHDVLIRLNATDVVKDDFCDNVANEACRHSVMQGYVANQSAGETMVDKTVGLFHRLRNRVDNAGRYHMGSGAHLLESGWAIKTDILEKIPYRQGHDIEHSEYTLRLALVGIKASWAPSIVVYRDAPVSLMGMLGRQVFATGNRLALISRYALPVLSRFMGHGNQQAALLWWSAFRPTEFIMGALLVFGAIISQTLPGLLGQYAIWLCFAGGVLAFHWLKMFVARCRYTDVVTSLLYTPMAYLMGATLIPLAAVNNGVQHFLRWQTQRQQARYRYLSQNSTRLNEDQAPLTRMMDEQATATTAYDLDDSSTEQEKTILPFETEAKTASPEAPSFDANNPLLKKLKNAVQQDRISSVPQYSNSVVEKIVPISNNEREVDAALKLHTNTTPEGTPLYKMVLEYKGVSLSTQRYKILDQAFYELQSKLHARGLTIVTCGSCGYYYHPTVDVHNLSKNTGVCLFGKLGRNVDIATDAVTVISSSCNYHTNLNEREAIVRNWQDSLAAPTAWQQVTASETADIQ